jgi:hypothetical protein
VQQPAERYRIIRRQLRRSFNYITPTEERPIVGPVHAASAQSRRANRKAQMQHSLFITDRPIRWACVMAIPVGLMALPTPAAASDSQLWTGGSATIRLSDNWALSQEITARFSDERDGLYEVETNTLLGYRLNKSVAIWAGYTHDPNYNGGRFAVMEHRFREQATIDHFAKLGGGSLSGRLRLEQRWRDGLTGTGWRLRPFLRYSIPIHRGSKTALTITEEPFIDFNKTTFQKVGGLERLRTFVGITTPVAKGVSTEIGYMNQHGFVSGGKDTNDNIASISLSLNL